MARDMKKGIQLLNFEVGMSPVLHPFPAFFLQNKKKKGKKKTWQQPVVQPGPFSFLHIDTEVC